MSGSTRAITLTLSVRDADSVKRTLEGIGPAGEQALARLEAAAQKAAGRSGGSGGMRQLAEATHQAETRFTGVGQKIGQAGFQIQDFAVQVQSGTSALTALSQQGSQLLGVFGTGGAIAGAVLTVGLLTAQILSGGDALKQFDDALKASNERLDRLDAAARRARESTGQLAESTVAQRDRFASLAPDQRAFETDRLQNELAVLQRQREALFRQAERNSGLAGIQNAAANVAAGLRSRGIDPTDQFRGLPEQVRLATAAMLEFRAATADGSQSSEQADASLARLGNRFAEASRLPGPLGDALRRATEEIDKLYPRGAQLDEAMQRIRASLLAAGEAAVITSGQMSAVSAEVERLARLAAQAATDMNSENALGLQRARERAQAIARGVGATEVFDAEARRRDNANRYYDEQKRRDEQRMRDARLGEDAIRAEILRTDEVRRQTADQRARQESDNDRRAAEARQAAAAARTGAAAARRDTTLDDRSRRERDQLISSLDEEAAANIRLEESLRRIAEARRRNQLTEEEATRYTQQARSRREQDIVRANDKSALDQAALRETEALTRDVGNTFTSAFEEAIVKGNDLRKVLNGLAEDLARIILRQSVVNPLANAASGLVRAGANALGNMIGGGTGGYTAEVSGVGMVKSAYGNAFANGRLIPFASGGMVDRATVVPMALMGEAGPEAVMPLRRGKDGKLGVAAAGGGGGGVVNNFTIDARGADPSVVPLIRAGVEEAVRRSQAQFLASIQRGGQAAKIVGRRA